MNLTALPEMLVNWLRNQGVDMSQTGGKGTTLPFQPGQVYEGKVLEALAQGRSLVQVANQTLDMALPKALQPGDSVRLTFLNAVSRPTFLLEQPTGSASPAVAVSQAARQVMAIIRYGQADGLAQSLATRAQPVAGAPAGSGPAPAAASGEYANLPRAAGLPPGSAGMAGPLPGNGSTPVGPGSAVDVKGSGQLPAGAGSAADVKSSGQVPAGAGSAVDVKGSGQVPAGAGLAADVKGSGQVPAGAGSAVDVKGSGQVPASPGLAADVKGSGQLPAGAGSAEAVKTPVVAGAPTASPASPAGGAPVTSSPPAAPSAGWAAAPPAASPTAASPTAAPPTAAPSPSSGNLPPLPGGPPPAAALPTGGPPPAGLDAAAPHGDGWPAAPGAAGLARPLPGMSSRDASQETGMRGPERSPSPPAAGPTAVQAGPQAALLARVILADPGLSAARPGSIPGLAAPLVAGAAPPAEPVVGRPPLGPALPASPAAGGGAAAVPWAAGQAAWPSAVGVQASRPVLFNPAVLLGLPAAPADQPAPALPGVSLSGQAVTGLLSALATHTAPRAEGAGEATLADGHMLPVLLRQRLVESGMFYESHLRGWSRGEMSLEAVRREPQAPLLDPAAPRLQLPDLEGMPEEAARLAARQLSMLEGGPFLWQGQIWPGQWMQWLVEEYQGKDPAPEELAPRWRTQVRLVLPRLGELSAELGVGALGLRIHLSTPDPDTLAEVRAALPDLVQRMRAADLKLVQLTAELATPALPEGGNGRPDMPGADHEPT